MKDKELLPDSFYEERRITPRWRQGVLPNAGIWLADGGYHVAVYGSQAQDALVERGALLVASLVFDGSHAERPVRGDATFDLYPAAQLAKPRSRRALETLGWAPIGN
ncbi:MAG TPA: hypothetical protein VGO40_13835 [Longimicrobium sp.]|jgi:hypothetical protein|nr:hypothetical protein [Longimicrobium sp.]